MSQKTRQRVIALVALTAILLFAYGAVNHWHRTPTAQDHCQVCHLAHSLSVGVSAAPLVVAPVVVIRWILTPRADAVLERNYPHVSSRAPPLTSPLS